jgi:hypothetical protein
MCFLNSRNRENKTTIMKNLNEKKLDLLLSKIHWLKFQTTNLQTKEASESAERKISP